MLEVEVGRQLSFVCQWQLHLPMHPFQAGVDPARGGSLSLSDLLRDSLAVLVLPYELDSILHRSTGPAALALHFLSKEVLALNDVGRDCEALPGLPSLLGRRSADSIGSAAHGVLLVAVEDCNAANGWVNSGQL
eukprot:6478820-Amphidinium_carterae.3